MDLFICPRPTNDELIAIFNELSALLPDCQLAQFAVNVVIENCF